MLKLSIEYEVRARESCDLCDFTTIFLVEHGADAKTVELAKSYPFDAKYIVRDKKYGLTVNILEGMKAAFDIADSFVLHLEDDILLHKDYFAYMKVLLSMVGEKYSVLSPFSPDDGGNVHEINKHNHYAALAPIISKYFFNRYIKKCAHGDYYNSPVRFVTMLNALYKEHWASRKYKYTNAAHYEQAGLINRLVDAAAIEDDIYIYMPRVNRQQHIGYFGKNRPGGKIPGKTFKERLKNLRNIILDADAMYKMSATKQYNDYKVFSPKLEEWDGTLHVAGYKGTCKDGA
jgi:hypothetical protein